MKNSNRIERRGGLAAGDPNNPAIPKGTSYDAFPPQSTYAGPTISGSETNFVLVVVFSGVLVLSAIGIGYWILRRRKILKRERYGFKVEHDGQEGIGRKGWKRVLDGDHEHEHEQVGMMYGSDAFEMDQDFKGSNVSLQLDTNRSPPPKERYVDHHNTPVRTKSNLLNPSPTYHHDFKHRSTSPGKEEKES
ncbi:uncharacterized protein MELLADRAFT_77073 [Melampsora larici-populina 98AG31]|uniref:Uncharacterized protein n=1 Tax=Melampsora larici-populina (strain 98AG31 / pathotype 3-4-7) TaxID=747676 RepID=F4RD25_MELLP|nr:uncharacterized protein MELLADRAFT_77073 [Melampsora larici-populina 98AG31]EGG09888.1 hypothetical protein MELLADRAFT_77073 [Melampsora larici-populina 98AG31]